MTSVFLCGPLAWPPLIQTICGASIDVLKPQSAGLPGYALVSRGDRCFALLVASTTKKTSGILIRDAGADVLARLQYFAAGLRHVPAEAKVDIAGNTVLAQVFVSEISDDSYDSDHSDDSAGGC